MTNFIYKHGILSVLFVCWTMAIVSYATLMMFLDIKAITTEAVAAYGSLLAIPPAGIALYKWRNKDVGNSGRMGPKAPEDR